MNWFRGSERERVAPQMLAPSAAAAAAAPGSSPTPRRYFGAAGDPARVIAHLPRVLARYVAFADAANDFATLARAIQDDIERARAEEARLQGRIFELRGGRIDATEAIAEAQGLEAHARDQKLRHSRRMESLDNSANALYRKVSGYLEQQHGRAALGEYLGPEPKLIKGQTARQSVEDCRAQLRNADVDIEHIDSAVLPPAEAVRLAWEEVDGLVRDGEPSVEALIQIGGKIGWQDSVAWAFGLDPASAINPLPQPNSRAEAAWRDPDGMKSRLRELILARYHQMGITVDPKTGKLAEDANVLTLPEREERRAAVLLRKLRIERSEEFYISTSEIKIERRPNADPRAVLGLDDNAQVPAS